MRGARAISFGPSGNSGAMTMARVWVFGLGLALLAAACTKGGATGPGTGGTGGNNCSSRADRLRPGLRRRDERPDELRRLRHPLYGAGQVCQNGACQCQTGLMSCNGSLRRVRRDPLRELHDDLPDGPGLQQQRLQLGLLGFDRPCAAPPA